MQLRPAIPADSVAIARVHVRSWQAAYRGLLAQEYLDNLRPEDHAAKYELGAVDPVKPHTIGATLEDEIRGFATTMPFRDQDNFAAGELCALYVDPDWWNRRIGLALVSAARERLMQLGLHHAILWLLEGNQRVERFYRTNGWTTTGIRRSDPVWGVTVQDIQLRCALR